MWSPARFAQSRWARRGVKALLWCIFAVASITLLARIIAAFLSSLPASRALLNASSFTFLSFILLMVSYSRGSAAFKRVSSHNYGALALGVIGAVAVVSYLPSLRDPFLFDDYTHLSNSARQTWSEMLASALFTHPAAGDPFFARLAISAIGWITIGRATIPSAGIYGTYWSMPRTAS